MGRDQNYDGEERVKEGRRRDKREQREKRGVWVGREMYKDRELKEQEIGEKGKRQVG